jgi:hypothetical protein
VTIAGDELKIINPSSSYAEKTELVYRRAK